MFLENGADINVANSNGETPLMLACGRYDYNTVEFLIKNGASVNERRLVNDSRFKDSNETSALQLAVASNNEKLINLLIKNGAIEKQMPEDESLLNIACSYNAIESLKYLIANDKNIKVDDLNEALLKVGENADKDRDSVAIIEILLQNNADIKTVDIYGNSLLILAAKNNVPEIIQFLLENGANINEETSNGETALMLAVRYNAFEALQFIIRNGANIEAKDNYGNTALMLAAENNVPKIAKYLIENGANIEAKDDYGNTVLMLAAENDDSEITKYLIESGANIEAKDNYGNTALMYSHPKSFKILLENGADIDVKNNAGETAIMCNSYRGFLSNVEMLIDYGANVNINNNVGETALMYSVSNIASSNLYSSSYEATAVAELLIKNGADVNIKNKSGRFAISLISSGNQENPIDLLLNHGYITKNNEKGNDYIPTTEYKREAVLSLLIRNNSIRKIGNDEYLWYDYQNTFEQLKGIIGFVDFENSELSEDSSDVEDSELSEDFEDSEDSGNSFSVVAAREENIDFLELLLDNGAILDDKDKLGRTPLMWASIYNMDKVVDFLIKKGANKKIVDNNNQTLLDLAGSDEMVSQLKKLGVK